MAVPTDHAGLSAWYDASQEAVFGDGVACSSLKDFALTGSDLAQATGSLQPVFRASVGGSGYKGYEFDGTDDFIGNTGTVRLSDVATNSAYTMFCVFTADAINTAVADTYDNDAVWCDNGALAGLHLHSTTPTARAYNWDGTDDHVDLTIALATRTLIMMRHEGGNLYISKNGGSESSVASGNTTGMTGLLTVGRNWSTGYFDGFLHDLAFWNVALTTGEVAGMNAYFGGTKWFPASATSAPKSLVLSQAVQRASLR